MTIVSLPDGVGECSALDAMVANGIVTGRISNTAQATIVNLQTFSVSKTFTQGSEVLVQFTPSLNSTSTFIYTQVRATGSGSLAFSASEYVDTKVEYQGSVIYYPIYPVRSYQNGPYLRSFRLGKIDINSSTGTIDVWAGPNTTVSRSLEVKITYIQMI